VFAAYAHEVGADGNIRSQEFEILEITTSSGDSTIYCALDGVIWPENENPVYVDFPDVFLMQVRTEFNIPGTGTDVLATIYLDRYTKPWLETANAIKEKILAQKAKISKIEAKEYRLKGFMARDGLQYDPRTLLKATVEHFAIPLKKSSDDDSIPMDSQPEFPDPIPMLNQLLRKLERKLSSMYSMLRHLFVRA
jgi:hypothetical protein